MRSKDNVVSNEATAARDASRRRKMRVGSAVFGGLLLLDVIEYFVGTAMKGGALIPMILLAVPSAWLILRFYMHVRQLRHGGEDA